MIMPRHYVRKTTRQNWSEDSMRLALDAVKDGMAFKTASKQFSVPLMSLKRRIKGKNKLAVGAVKILGSKRTVFTTEQEEELIQHIKEMEIRMYGLTKQEILSLAYQLAEKNKIQHPFSSTRGKAGIEWLKGFRKRHPDITLRSPESTSAARARAFNKPVVDKFFSILKDTQARHYFPPYRIFNVDETSVCTVPTKNTKVFAQTGRKQVARVTSAERGDTTTAVICGSAAGNFIPPMFIFRRVRMKMELMDGAPPGSAYACNTTGWMKLEVFEQWFDHFLTHVKPSKDDPAMLILDGHLSHTKNLNVVLKARENNVLIMCLPPHCTHKLQPLDVAVMYPLSIYHNQALEKWMNNNPGRVVTVFQITSIFSEAYLKAATPSNLISGFLKCGIYPLNQDVFSDVDYVAAETTEMEADVVNTDTDDSTHSVSILTLSASTEVMQTSDALQESFNPKPSSQLSIGMETDEISVISTNKKNISNPPMESSAILPVLSCESLPKQTDSSAVVSPLSPLPCSPMEFNAVNLPSTSFACFSPQDVQPLPKIEGKRSKIVRKKIDTSILTSTPYKTYLEEEMEKKRLKEEKQIARNINKGKKTISTKNPKEKANEKGKEAGKVGKNKKQSSDSVKNKKRKPDKKKKEKRDESKSSEDEDDTECMFCTEPYSRDRMGEGWVRCVVCLNWGHEACAGIDSDDPDEFTCDICITVSRDLARKQLEF